MEQQIQLTKKERKVLRRKERLEQEQKQVKSKLVKRITFWVLTIVIVSGAVFSLVMIKNTANTNNIVKATTSISDTDWTRGNKTAPVTLIEYSDFQCPACGSYSLVIKQLILEFESDIYFAYRHFPLKQIHKNANLAAWAAEAAGKQDKFWEMHDIIFENQKEWSNENSAKNIFVKYAEILNLNLEQFEIDINAKEIKNKVDNDYRGGISLGVNSTPSFFLNGEKIQNPRSYDDFKKLIQEIISNN